MPTVTSKQVTVSSVAMKSQNIPQIISAENKKQIVDEKLIVEQIQYTPEPIVEETMEITCGVGTE